MNGFSFENADGSKRMFDLNSVVDVTFMTQIKKKYKTGETSELHYPDEVFEIPNVKIVLSTGKVIVLDEDNVARFEKAIA